ncbi:sensor histidine kinase [Mucilaginibacter ginsenosidivorans]|nr:sensor histidine kinase [Mucilaginibacter ginsenosidivorans]
MSWHFSVNGAESTVLIYKNILPGRTIKCLFIDRDGYLWIGHKGGVSRYDGIIASAVPLGPGNQEIDHIIQDEQGGIWLTGDKTNLYYLKDQQKPRLLRRKSKNDRFQCLLYHDHQVYVTSESGLYLFDSKSLSCKGYRHHNDFPAIDEQATNIFAISGHIFVYNMPTGDIFSFSQRRGFRKLNNIISRDRKDAFGMIYQSNSSGTVLFAEINAPVINYSRLGVLGFNGSAITPSWRAVLPNDRLLGTASEPDGTLWYGGINTIYCSDGRQFPGYNMRDLACDREGNLWFVTRDRGLFMLPYIPARKRLDIPGEQIASIAVDHSGLIAGTNSGKIYLIDPEQRKIALIFNTDSVRYPLIHVQRISHHRYLFDGGLATFIYDDSLRKTTRVGWIFSDSLKTAGGDGLVLHTDGLFGHLLRPDSPLLSQENLLPAEFSHYTGRPRPPDFITGICYDTVRHCFIAGVKRKVIEFDKHKRRYIRFGEKDIDASALCSTGSKEFIAVKEKGIIVHETGKTRLAISADRLPLAEIRDMKVIGSHILLAGPGEQLLMNLRSDKLEGERFGEDMDMRDIVATNDSVYILSRETIYSEPLKNLDVQAALPCAITYAIFNGADTLSGSRISYSHALSDVEFVLSFPALRSPEETRYQYRFADTRGGNWRFLRAGLNVVHFASLAPGNYVFETRAWHPVLGPSSNSVTCRLTIPPAWWQTTWFNVFAAITIALLIFLAIRIYYHMKLTRQRLYFEKELAVEKERQSISRDIHDDIGQALSVIKLNLGMGAPGQLEEAKSILNEVIGNLRDFTHNLYYGKLLMHDLVESIKRDAERLNLAKKIDASVNIDWQDGFLDDQTELLVYRIFQEAVNNILKHADAKHIWITVSSTSKRFRIAVRDDGSGFEQTSAHEGLGISNMQKRAAMAGGVLSVLSEKEQGTEISVVIQKPKK